MICKVAFDYDVAVLPQVKQFSIYNIDVVDKSPTFGQRVPATPIATTTTPPTETAPLSVDVPVSAGMMFELQAVPVDLNGAEGPAATFTSYFNLPPVTNFRRVG